MYNLGEKVVCMYNLGEKAVCVYNLGEKVVCVYNLGEKAECATLVRRQSVCNLHIHILSYIQVQCQCYPPLRQLHSCFRDFINEVCHVTESSTTAESNPETGLLHTKHFASAQCSGLSQ